MVSNSKHVIDEEVEELMYEDMEKQIDRQEMLTLRFLYDKGWND